MDETEGLIREQLEKCVDRHQAEDFADIVDAGLMQLLLGVGTALRALDAPGSVWSDDFANLFYRDGRRHKKSIPENVVRAGNASTNTAQRREHPRWACRILLRSD